MKFIVLFSCLVIVSGYPKAVDLCSKDNCQIEDNCRCSSTIGPIVDYENPAPQFLSITVSEAVVQTLYDNYLKPLFFGRTNPDGSSIGLTFYVPHEYTDYSLVQDLYKRGFEIGDHSITKHPNQTYWKLYTKEDLIEEFRGQREIISHFANIPQEVITGVRTPQLLLNGDISIEAYRESGLLYDNSWPTMSSMRLFPYTLDYASTQLCTTAIYKCPKESHPGFWVVPITDIVGAEHTECNSLATCLVQGTADEIADWLLGQLNIVRTGTRSPLSLRLDSYWFEFTGNSYQGFTKFLDRLKDLNDVFMVNEQDVIEWLKNPVPLSEYTVPDHSGRTASCQNVNCRLLNERGEEKYMKSCVSCPDAYPWKGNPMGQ